MDILIDTHIALWSLYASDQLSEKAVSYLTDPSNKIFYSYVTMWEIQIKHSIGKLPMTAEIFMQDCNAAGFFSMPIRKEHIIGLDKISYSVEGHKDPFDRLLLAQALSEKIVFLTEDRKILRYPYNFILPVAE